MREFLGTVWVIGMIVGMSGEAWGSTACEGIRDADMRHYCRALMTGRVTWCEVIRDGDLRRRCRAEVARPGRGAGKVSKFRSNEDR